ncbi:FAD-binding oxidoreductase [Nannocystis radixulma]|uniref:FAD-binding oxidoreductase n=1 Tax=Nannocystis radixulma TaxID=2995305 RepID=A0ABT5AWH0_9BACT|nr:FAD-binding oxidoreductase [Nannocystis radixulma]MDC0666193.1 FAD-binding oxidoreductase [Nannocystis radixulma]
MAFDFQRHTGEFEAREAANAASAGEPVAQAPVGERLQQALIRIQPIVGERHIVTDAGGVEERGRVLIPAAGRAVAYVYPGSAEEVQQLVRVADELAIPLWPASKGRNWGYGAASPVRDGAIVLVLERLNRIIEVHEELAYAVIEPGVTYRQFNAYLKQHHPDLWCDTTDGTPEGSVIGNALEKGIGETPYGDHFGNLCGMEVVLPTGELVRTGGGPANLATRHTYKWGTGPFLDGMFAQSNLGIVTRAGIWLMPRPEAFCSFTFALEREADFPVIIDRLRDLALKDIIQTKVHLINDFAFLSLVSQYPFELRNGATRLSRDTIRRLAAGFGVTSWSFITGLYGTREEVRLKQAAIRRAFAPYGKLTFITDDSLRRLQGLSATLERMRQRPRLRAISEFVTRRVLRTSPEILAVAPHSHALLQGIPSDFFVGHAYFKAPSRPATDVHPARDQCGLIWFAPIAPMTGRHVGEVIALCEPLFERRGFEIYVALMMINPRSMVVLMGIFYRKDDPDETARATALYGELSDATLVAGYQQYRATVGLMPQILDTAPEFKAAAGRIKSALDPNNILAPGRYGL